MTLLSPNCTEEGGGGGIYINIELLTDTVIQIDLHRSFWWDCTFLLIKNLFGLSGGPFVLAGWLATKFYQQRGTLARAQPTQLCN